MSHRERPYPASQIESPKTKHWESKTSNLEILLNYLIILTTSKVLSIHSTNKVHTSPMCAHDPLETSHCQSYWSFLNLDWIPTSSGVTKLSLPDLVQTLILISPVPETVKHKLTNPFKYSTHNESMDIWKKNSNWKIYECYIHYTPVQDPSFEEYFVNANHNGMIFLVYSWLHVSTDINWGK